MSQILLYELHEMLGIFRRDAADGCDRLEGHSFLDVHVVGKQKGGEGVCLVHCGAEDDGKAARDERGKKLLIDARGNALDGTRAEPFRQDAELVRADADAADLDVLRVELEPFGGEFVEGGLGARDEVAFRELGFGFVRGELGGFLGAEAALGDLRVVAGLRVDAGLHAEAPRAVVLFDGCHDVLLPAAFERLFLMSSYLFMV